MMTQVCTLLFLCAFFVIVKAQWNYGMYGGPYGIGGYNPYMMNGLGMGSLMGNGMGNFMNSPMGYQNPFGNFGGGLMNPYGLGYNMDSYGSNQVQSQGSQGYGLGYGGGYGNEVLNGGNSYGTLKSGYGRRFGSAAGSRTLSGPSSSLQTTPQGLLSLPPSGLMSLGAPGSFLNPSMGCFGSSSGCMGDGNSLGFKKAKKV